MPNSTRLEPAHASMKSCQMKKKIGLIEACKVNQNRAAGQIAVFIAYREGCYGEHGPILFELAYRNADSMRFLDAFEKTSNLLLESNENVEFYRKEALHGDITTTSPKQKEKASAVVEENDSHRHDRVMRTTASPLGLKRRILHTDFHNVVGNSSTPRQ